MAAEKLLAETGVKIGSLALDLVNVLLGRGGSADVNEYGKQRRRLKGEALDEYCAELKRWYAATMSRAAYPTRDPEDNLRGLLRALGPACLFQFEGALIKKLLLSYGSDRRRGERKVSPQLMKVELRERS